MYIHSIQVLVVTKAQNTIFFKSIIRNKGSLGVSVFILDRFAINSTTGVITTKAGLNREDEDTYSVTVTATDQDPDEDKRRSQAVQVTITGRYTTSWGVHGYTKN